MTRNDFSTCGNRVAFDINSKTVQFVIWDFDTFTQKQQDDCLNQLALIISLGGNFAQIEKHMKLNGYDCELEDIYEA